MDRSLLIIVIIPFLWHTCSSTHECNRTTNGGTMTFTCPSTVSSQVLRLYDLTTAQLDLITSFVANSFNSTSSGPFTALPPNICLLRNLQSINFSHNQIVQIDPTGSFSSCLSNLVTIDFSYNNISQFPSTMILNMTKLQNLYFQHNKLTEVPSIAFNDVSVLEIIDFSYNQLTTFELWTVDVKTRADFSNNLISAITNKYFYSKSFNRTIEQSVSLTNNSAMINFTDAVYEMYNQCEEAYVWYFSLNSNPPPPWFTIKLSYIDFGTTQINCSCDQVYYLTILASSQWTAPTLPLKSATCLNNSLNVGNTPFLNSSCANPSTIINSTANFPQAYPRLCAINTYESGALTNVSSVGLPSLNTSTYPHYQTVFLSSGACFLTFINATTMNIQCTNDTSNTASTFPTSLLSNPYMLNITRVNFNSTISSLPFYLCSLPSRQIDLSYQAFTTLSDATFPCLDAFQTVKLSSNQITSVNMASGNFTNLTSLDLSANYLTALPYSILRPSPTSLRYLNLRNNSIAYIDLFIYTLQNITIYLDGNPINSSSILNPQNITLANNTNPTVNITYPSTVTNSSYVIQDSIAVTYGLCNSFSLLRSYLLDLRSIYATVLLNCTCASFNLGQLYLNNGYTITNDFNCSNASATQSYANLNSASCPNATSFLTGLCANQSVQDTSTTPFGSNFSSSGMTSISTVTANPISLSPSGNASSTTTLSSNNNSVTISSNVSMSASPTATTTLSPVQSTSGGGGLGSSNSDQSNANRIGLIVGLTIGLFILLVAALVGAYYLLTYRASKTSLKKTVGRTGPSGGGGPGDTLESRVQSRIARSKKLAPLTASTSRLPAAPVAAVAAPTTSDKPFSNNISSRTPAKGIPLRLEPIRSPSSVNPQNSFNSNALNNSSSFRSINNLSSSQAPRTNQMLNVGGDNHH